ncbi:hypothetical protein HZC34_06130 [Candidatus Saganbacteria bacterium]|nr:hypothetical protein [Candidatus Saganbacteria bacterium]
MKEFFTNQMDYIYFLYGFAFLVFSISCYFLGKSKSSKLPWNSLFFFALLHGLNEWADMLVFSIGDAPYFNFTRTVTLGISYFFLFEFGRIALKDQKKIGLGTKIYLLMSLCHNPVSNHQSCKYFPFYALV